MLNPHPGDDRMFNRTFLALTLALGAAPAFAAERPAPTDASIDAVVAAIPDWNNPTHEQMLAFVQSCADHIALHGKEAAFKDFQVRPGKLNKGELYIYAYDFDCLVLAHGAKPALVGKNLSDLTDKKGLKVIQALRDAARKGSGEVEFFWENPTTKKIQRKLGYVIKIDDGCWIGSGIYMD